MRNQKGLGLIGVLLIISTLILTAGGAVVWEEKTRSTPFTSPTPTPILTPPTEIEFPPALTSATPVQLLQKRDELLEQQVTVVGFALLAPTFCIMMYNPSCGSCLGEMVLAENKEERIEYHWGNLSGYPGKMYDNAIGIREQGNLVSCAAQGIQPNCTYSCVGWELEQKYKVTGVWSCEITGGRNYESRKYYLNVTNKQKL